MEAAAQKLLDQGAKKVLQVGKKAIGLSEEGIQASTRGLYKQMKQAAKEGTTDSTSFLHNMHVPDGKKLGMVARIRLSIKHLFSNKLLGRFKKTAEETAETATEQTVAAATSSKGTATRAADSSIGAMHNRQVERLRSALEG